MTIKEAMTLDIIKLAAEKEEAEVKKPAASPNKKGKDGLTEMGRADAAIKGTTYALNAAGDYNATGGKGKAPINHAALATGVASGFGGTAATGLTPFVDQTNPGSALPHKWDTGRESMMGKALARQGLENMKAEDNLVGAKSYGAREWDAAGLGDLLGDYSAYQNAKVTTPGTLNFRSDLLNAKLNALILAAKSRGAVEPEFTPDNSLEQAQGERGIGPVLDESYQPQISAEDLAKYEQVMSALKSVP